MGGKRHHPRRASQECPCGEWHDIPQGHSVCNCHGLRLADIEHWTTEDHVITRNGTEHILGEPEQVSHPGGKDDQTEAFTQLLAAVKELGEFWENRITGDQLDDVNLVDNVLNAAERARGGGMWRTPCSCGYITSCYATKEASLIPALAHRDAKNHG